ncbi:hypothetical protein ACWGIN_00305 [Streptomyces sp. NPDC054861]
MLVSHLIDDGTLHVKVQQDLNVTNRAAAALQVEALVSAHRPGLVVFELPSATPSPATLSAVARARRMCQSIGVPFSLTGPATSDRRLLETASAGEAAPRLLEFGARRDH